MKKKIVIFLLCLGTLVSLQGCSAVMAASGTKEANLSAINKGDTRSMVFAKVGQQPARVINNSNGVIEIYELERGNEPSTGRAVANGALSLFTLGLWEVVGTPLEGMKGEKYFLTVYYNQNEILEKYEVSATRPN